jgi:hypothetical protein
MFARIANFRAASARQAGPGSAAAAHANDNGQSLARLGRRSGRGARNSRAAAADDRQRIRMLLDNRTC